MNIIKLGIIGFGQYNQCRLPLPFLGYECVVISLRLRCSPAAAPADPYANYACSWLEMRR